VWKAQTHVALLDSAPACVHALKVIRRSARKYSQERDIYDRALTGFAKEPGIELGGVVATSATHWSIRYGLHLAATLPQRDRRNSKKTKARIRELLNPSVVGTIRSALPSISELRKLRTQVELEFWQASNPASFAAQEPVAPKIKNTVLQIRDNQVYRNNELVPLNMTTRQAKKAIGFLAELLKDPGNWKSSTEIGRATGTKNPRYDRIFKILPIEIKSYIDSDRRKGYRYRYP
jgi:hypothetical protein